MTRPRALWPGAYALVGTSKEAGVAMRNEQASGRKRVSIGIAVAGLIIGLLSVAAAGYVDDFTIDPGGDGQTFTTTELSYSGSCAGIFFWINQTIDIWGCGVSWVRIEAIGGGAFDFASIRYRNDNVNAATVTGTGAEPFTFTIPGSSGWATYSPSGGAKSVTLVEITGTQLAGPFDDVTVTVADTTKPDVTINKSGGQANPTNGSPVLFTAVFNEPINEATFISTDVSVGGTATTDTVSVTEIAPNDDTTFEISIVVTDDGTVVATIPAGGVEDVAGNTNNASTSTENSVTYDTTDPTDPTPSSSSHTVSVWDNDNTIDIQISGASDAGSGVDGFEIEWDKSASWAPSETKEQEETWSGATFTATSDGDWYFHIATVDNAGNWTSTQHLGPFQIDTTPPSVPTGLDPSNSSYTSDTSPILSWAASTDSGSGIRTTGAYRIVVTGPVNRDTYVSDTDYNPTLSEGTFTWKLYARDNAGNSSSYAADTTLYIDTTQPDVTINEAVTQVDPTNTSPVVFTAAFDESINLATFVNTDVEISGTATTGAVVLAEIAPNDGTTFSITVPVTADGTVIADIPAGRVEDYAGNTNTISTSTDNTVTYDAADPQVNSVTASDLVITDTDAGAGNLQVAAVFNESMNTGDIPTFTFNPDVTSGGTPTLSNPSGAWGLTVVANDTYTITYDVADQDIDIDSVTVDITGGQDLAGNGQTDYSPVHEFEIDTLNPSVLSVTAAPTQIADATAGSDTFTVTTIFSETMETGTLPVLTFAPDVTAGGTPTISSGSGAWSQTTVVNDTYTVTYDAADLNEDINSVTIDITSAEDAAGNAQQNYAPAHEFDIDTVNPTVGIVVSDQAIFDGDVGVDVFTVTATFSEAMNPATIPTLTFTPNPATTLTNPSGVWSGGNTIYTWTYDIEDAGVTVADIDVTVSGAVDVAENTQVSNTLTDHIDIDTLNPTVTGVAVDDMLLSDSDAGTTLTVTVDFSEPMIDDGSADPALTFNPGVGLTLAYSSDSWPTSSRYQAVYDISDVGVDVDSVTIDVTLSKDKAGNDQVNYAPLHEFAIDTINPTVTLLTLSDNEITDADVNGTFTVTIDYSEPMLTTAPSIVFSPALTSTLSLQAGNSGWTDTDTYVFSYTILDGNVTVLDDDITITNAQDLAGNVQVAYNYDDQLDVDTENPYFHDFTVTGGAVDGTCTRTVTFTAKVTDPNGTMAPGDITVTSAVVTNATIGAVYGISQTSDSATTITITGSVDVTALTGCPARVTITLDAVDSVDNEATQQAQSDDVVDTTIPIINDLRFDTDGTHATLQVMPYLVDECGLVTVYFSANVTDNCCIVPGNVIVTATLPMLFGEGAAILEDVIVNRVQNGQGRVDVTGQAIVRCLESCLPGICLSRVQINVAAVDCCGNVAVPDATGILEGLVGDTILPIPQDDPRQDMVMDESAIIDPLVEVRIDEFGTYRLILRESTPVRIDIMGNDADNLSHNTSHPFGPCIACGPCSGQTGCCAVMYIHEIVKAPSYGTATIEDDTGDCTGGTVVRYAPDRGYLGPDYFTYRTRDAFGNISSVIATVYLQTVPEVWMEDVFAIACTGETVEFTVSAADLFIDPDDPSIIQFAFSIDAGPEHGVVRGSLLDVVYTPPSTATDPRFNVQVPSLDFSEAAAVALTYTPADGFVGRDQIRVRFEDPFGGVAIAVVDITVGQCAAEAAASVIHLIQGRVLPLILPISFESVFEAGWGTVTLILLEDGTHYPDLILVEWNEVVNRHILTINTEELPLGRYELKIPLGTGEIVTLRLQVGESE